MKAHWKPITILLTTLFLIISSPAYCEESDSDAAVEKTGDYDQLSVEDLMNRLNALEQELNEMQEQSEARKRLEITEEEKSEKEKDILSAAGRQYTLMKKGRIGFEYQFYYSFNSYETLEMMAEDSTYTVVDHKQSVRHSLTNNFTLEYPVLDNLTASTTIPFVYKYDDESGTTKDVNSLGDVSFAIQWQPTRSGGNLPTTIINTFVSVPMGKSPYDIDPTQDLATSSGYYSLGTGVSLSKTLDPVMIYGGLNYTHNFTVDGLHYKYGTLGEAGIEMTKVEPGDQIGFSIGTGFSLSYNVSMNMSYQYSYNFGSKQYWTGAGAYESPATVSSKVSFGTGWRFTPKQSVNIKLGIGLTKDDSDFTLSVRLPFEFEM